MINRSVGEYMLRIKKLVGIALSILVVFLNYSYPIRQYNSIPEEIILSNNQSSDLNFGIPVKFEVENTCNKVNIRSLSKIFGFSTEANITSNNLNNTYLSIYPFGLFPDKEIKLVSKNEKQVILGGQSIGIVMKTDGVLIVGFSKVINKNGSSYSPAEKAGLQVGDLIKTANNSSVDDIGDLSEIVDGCKGSSISIDIERNKKDMECDIIPVVDLEDGKYHIGIWGRDGSSGIGTLTYIDLSDMTFGALGHPITDMDTGEILPIGNGSIYYSNIKYIFKGISGQPGELKGQFDTSEGPIANISENSVTGIFGTLKDSSIGTSEGDFVSVADKKDVELGPARILTTIDSRGPVFFDCEIIKINNTDSNSNKNMVIKVTDEDLIEKTGGIVQGMSGSPIIQNDKLIGAITHVFINDPTCGHAIFIENMLYH